MWFKQIQLYQLSPSSLSSSASALADKLEPLAFTPCLPSMPSSLGWVSPLEEADEHTSLVRGLNQCLMICLQIEEKILPASVIALALKERVKQIEEGELRKVRKKEKLSLKDETVFTLLPRAFSKITRLLAYIDTKNHWLILNTPSPAKATLFLNYFKKTLGDIITPFDVIKPSAVLTHWLKSKEYPQEFAIEKTCVLQDPQQQTRLIRAQQQDLFADGMQAILTEGYEVMQLGLCWQDRLSFVLADNFTLRQIRLTQDDTNEIHDELETSQQKFDADFILMTQLFDGMLNELLQTFGKEEHPHAKNRSIAPLAAAV